MFTIEKNTIQTGDASKVYVTPQKYSTVFIDGAKCKITSRSGYVPSW